MNPGKNIIFLSLLISLPLSELFCQVGPQSTKSADSSDGKKRSFYVGIIGGLTFDNYVLKFPNNEFQSFSDPSPFAGIGFKLLNPDRGLGILFQSTIAHKGHHYSYLLKNAATNDYFETTLKSLASTSRIGLTVFRPKKSFLTPFVETGILASFYLNQKYENYMNQVYSTDNTIFSFYNEDKLNSSFYYGAFVETGLMFNLNNGNLFILSGGYNYLISPDIERIQSFDISINYILKFK